jgi:phage terminase large subunit-like protein
MTASLAERFTQLPPDVADDYLSSLSDDEADALLRDWEWWARPEQMAPAGVWRWWLLVTGRGWGKNRTGAEWVVERCEAFAAAGMPHLVGLIGQNNDDVKALQIGGISGLREVVRRRGHRWIGAPGTLEPSIGIMREDGTEHVSNIEVHTAVEPEGPRGRNFHTLWIDELAAFKHKVDTVGNTVFTNAELALRGQCPAGMVPQGCVTTTPKPIPVIRDLLASKHGPTIITRGSIYDNASNLPSEFIDAVVGRYQGTRLAEQELYGKVIDSVEGALWTPDMIHRWRIGTGDLPELSVTVVAVDPSGSEEGGDHCGIVVVGMAKELDGQGRQHLYVLEDASTPLRPEKWAAAAVAAYHQWGAAKIVAEVNFGALMVQDMVKLTDPDVRFEPVRASRAKRIRAEPVALLYDSGQGRVHHVGVFPELEEQMSFWTPLDPTSPDRLDALVWGCAALIPDLTRPPAEFAKGWASRRAA